MRIRLKTAALLCGTGTLLLSGRYAVPLMQHTLIGAPAEVQASGAVMQQAPSAPAAADPEPAVTQSGTETVPEVHAENPAPENTGNIINIESDGSQAMWFSRLYSCPDSDSGGKIIDRHFSAQKGAQFLNLTNGGQVRNCTFWSNSDLLAESKIAPSLDLKMDGTPMVLIYHTHTTESFVSEKTGAYDASCIFRTTEPDKNMVMVGDAIAEQLSAAGIGVVHAREIHDYPVWSGAYSNSAKTIQSVLEQYPSICIALDIHRDAISDGSTVVAPVCTINGNQSAQIMIISGCDKGNMGMPNYRENFHLASAIQQTAEGMFPGFTRPILFDYRKYNQNLTNGSLLIEVGSQGNTLEEARYAGELVGKSLSETIRKLCEGGN
ncbi:MAG: stage II sporulation protein P [Oscillospiraceae bacterium]|nr:stage II sporulation protein P [Oscillospiraceae bacterium]